jgi:hypothetical protein
MVGPNVLQIVYQKKKGIANLSLPQRVRYRHSIIDCNQAN